MRSHLLSLLLAAFVCLSAAVNVSGPEHAVELEARGNNVCKSVKAIVTILKAHKATPFCSSFLGISTQTVTETTSTTTTTSIETQVATSTTTSTTIWTTFSLSTTIYKQRGVSTTTIRSTTETVTATTTITESPTSPLTITGYYTPSPDEPADEVYKRTAVAALVQRGGNLPAYISPYPSNSISQACNCLSLSTPTTTTRIIFTSTTTSTTLSSTTRTETQSAYVRDISATTSYYTFLVPEVYTTYTTVTDTVTTTAGSYPSTTHVRRQIPSECINIGPGRKLYNSLTPGNELYRMDGYTIAGAAPGEEIRGQCCLDCWNRMNCMYWRLYSRTQAVPGGLSTTKCPLGNGTNLLQEPISNPGDDNAGFGKGPCL
ncbi:hypothetical protein QBC37DRAFT_407236 [Rhypophila decipiens]|uniref:Apple domain-containing protein n=1 Tax=Rhypophila decipiens TaxID=261697 RepID=A0AAN7B0E7_9PEZI|nr:hypothetical protein QBC37DRAFT_407236 [Rhypophila decipiens]